MWVSSLLFILGGVFLLFVVISPTGSARALSLLSAPLFIAGGYLGLLPLQATVLVGFAAFGLSVFMMFYHPSSA